MHEDVVDPIKQGDRISWGEIRTDLPSKPFHGLALANACFQIYDWLESRLPDFTWENWTSKYRGDDEKPPFLENEAKYSDFTYHDHDGSMRMLLEREGVSGLPASTDVTYHLEVKSTPGACDSRPAKVSKFQRERVS